MIRHKLSGAGAAIPTPFTPDGRVDYPALARTIDYIIDGGVDFIVALGTMNDRFALTAKGTPIECPPPKTREAVGFVMLAISSDIASPASTSPPSVLRMNKTPSILSLSSSATRSGNK